MASVETHRGLSALVLSKRDLKIILENTFEFSSCNSK
jgi:hypothetical protein